MFGLMPFERNDIWNPFRDFEKDFFKGFGTVSHCRTDIKDEGDKYLLECEMPGLDKDDIKIDISGNTLNLCAERKAENDEKNSSGEYIRRERNYSSYCRSFDISNIDENSIGAEYTNGILKLSLPKKEKEQPQSKRIEIK
ncbi:MAG: Hsp20/alpha crystallin family protein [Ruminococcus sp.]|nr:Hsp20/alpha crystallin family protein [Ruminococcus sp.]